MIAMQGMKSVLLILLLPLFALADNHWDAIFPGGGMRFQGIVIAESCNIEVIVRDRPSPLPVMQEDKDQLRPETREQQMTIHMGQISSNWLHAVGADTNPVPFDIQLQECGTAVSQRVGVAFHGVADSKNPDVLSIGEGPGIAKGVGIALFDKKGNQIPLNSPPGAWVPIYTGLTTLNFVAKYRATGHQVTGGAANAQVWFSLTYQ